MKINVNRESFDDLVLMEKISIAYCLGFRTSRPRCRCCGGSLGVRRALRKLHRHSGKEFFFRKGKGYKKHLKKNKRETIRYQE